MEGTLRDIQLNKLSERAKELKCLYQVSEALKDENAELMTVFKLVLEAIPPGFQHPTICEAQIILEGKQYTSPDFKVTDWMQKAEIIIDNHVAGEILVSYLQDISGKGMPFLPEEQKLLNVIASQLSRFIFHRRLKKTLESTVSPETVTDPLSENSLLAYESDEHWRWRCNIAEKIAAAIDFDRFGIEAVYLIGSTKDCKAGPGSDIDMMVHFRGNPIQEKEFSAWIEGWGLGLAELNFMKTGYRIEGSLIDCHVITDQDIERKTSYAVMIGSTSNSARLLRSRSKV